MKWEEVNRSEENANKRGGVVIAVVREDREMWEAAKLQLDCNLATLVFLALLTFGGCFQYSSKYKQACREMLSNSLPHQVCQSEVLIYMNVLCCFILHRTAKQHNPHLQSIFTYKRV